MKVSLNWLAELVELPPTVSALVDLLTLAGVEVEGVASRGVDIAKVVVAQIKESVQHPNADRLSICQVDDGSGVARQIVCGAKNYKVGDKVPLALPGAKLPGDFTIKVGKLRGVESQGMLCSAKELNLAEDAEGLLILPPDARIGAPLSELFPGDTILDLEITPNRADLLSMNGMAREIGALTGKAAKLSAPKLASPLPEQGTVTVHAPELCPFYTMRKVAGVKVGPSPDWLRTRLESVGLRSINNVVDVTNYVMLESGQPLHAFDADTLHGAINVRCAEEGEKFTALDGNAYALTPQHLLIADAERPVAIAGVMGRSDTGVSGATVNIILESAYFQPQSIRRTSRQLGLLSDSSYRFERGVDVTGVEFAGQRALELIVEIAGGSPGEVAFGPPQKTSTVKMNFTMPLPEGFDATSGLNEIVKAADKTIQANLQTELSKMVGAADSTFLQHAPFVRLRPERVAALLGTFVSEERIDSILTALGLTKLEVGWLVPSWRPDLTREVDLIEEIARVIGMDAIPARTQARFAPASETDRAYDRAMKLRRAFVGLGFHEARSLTLVPAEPRGVAFTQTAPGTLQRVKNPMIDDQVVLRPNLMPGLLEAVARNVRAGEKSVRLFEVGRTFSTIPPEEFSHAAVVLSGPIGERSWRGGEGREADFFDLKGVISAVLGSAATFEPEENAALALSLCIKVAGECVGLAGQLWPAESRALDAVAPVLFAELDLAALAEAEKKSTAGKYREIPRFPATSRDIALLAPATLPHAQIASALQSAHEPLLAGVELFDVFTDPTGAKVPADKKSLAYSLTYRAPDRTLTAEEVNAAHARLKARLTRDLGVALRE